MKLLISTDLFYPSNLGGPANTLYWLAKGLVNKNVDVTVVTTDDQIEIGKVKSDSWGSLDGIKIIYCKKNRWALCKMLFHTWKELKDCDTIMLCDMFQRQVIPIAIMSQIMKKKIIWSARGELMSSAINNSKAKKLYLLLVRRLFASKVFFHATSVEEKEAMSSFFPNAKKICIIPNYMELPPKMEREASPPPFLLYLGRIAPIKALDRLIEGLALSDKFRNSDFILKIAGGVEKQFDNYYKQLLAEIKDLNLSDKVKFVGPINGVQKFQTYANAYVMFLISHSENFGNVVIESLSQGTPVVASKGTPWDLLEISKAGFWIENSAKRIATAIDTLLSLDEHSYNRIRQNAYVLGKSYDISSNVDKWLDVLTQLHKK